MSEPEALGFHTEPWTRAGDRLLTHIIQSHEAPSYHVIEMVRRGILAIEEEMNRITSANLDGTRAVAEAAGDLAALDRAAAEEDRIQEPGTSGIFGRAAWPTHPDDCPKCEPDRAAAGEATDA